MKILYIHGFGSKYDPDHEKIKLLETLGDVVGVDLDYCDGHGRAIEKSLAMVDDSVDLIIGTGMGGYTASFVSVETNIPFVALNPITSPSQTLEKWIGNFVDGTGRDHCLTEAAVSSYPDMTTEGNGIVFVESADEVVKTSETIDALDEYYKVELFSGGNHKFTHLENILLTIKEFYRQNKQ